MKKMYNDDVKDLFDYLNKLYFTNKIKNPNFIITANMVYSILVNFNEPKENIEPLFNIWIDRFRTRPGIDVLRTFNWPYFCQFTNGKLDPGNAIKLYVPLRRHNLDANVTRIFEFMRSNNIIHRSKVALETRNDNVVIRVSNENDAQRIINFVNSSPDIKKELGNLNPLVPKYNNIGIVKDGNCSYNSVLAIILSDILNSNVRLTKEFYCVYLNKRCSETEDNELKMIYTIAADAFKEKTLSEIVNVNYTRKNRNKILFIIMQETFEKYDEIQVERALFEYITNNNTTYFTRGIEGNLRTELTQSLNPEEVLKIVEETVGKSNNIEDTLKKFVSYILADKIANRKENNNADVNEYFEYLKNIYLEYGSDHLNEIIRLHYQGKIKYKDDIYIIYKKILRSLYKLMNDNKMNEYINDGTILTIISNIVISNTPRKQKV